MHCHGCVAPLIVEHWFCIRTYCGNVIGPLNNWICSSQVNSAGGSFNDFISIQLLVQLWLGDFSRIFVYVLGGFDWKGTEKVVRFGKWWKWKVVSFRKWSTKNAPNSATRPHQSGPKKTGLPPKLTFPQKLIHFNRQVTSSIHYFCESFLKNQDHSNARGEKERIFPKKKKKTEQNEKESKRDCKAKLENVSSKKLTRFLQWNEW